MLKVGKAIELVKATEYAQFKIPSDQQTYNIKIAWKNDKLCKVIL